MKYSRVLLLLSAVQMWKFFSHFGVRVLLMLYMVSCLKYPPSRAFGMNAVFCGLIELGGIFGGLIADRYLGLKKLVVIGGWLLTVGYFGLVFQTDLFWSMGLIIVGSSLFSSNIIAILGLYYAEDSKREEGFTFFYMMQNLGALLSTVICGYVAAEYGFQWAFAIAASGMVIGNCILLTYRDVLRQNVLETVTIKNHIIAPAILISVILVIGIFSIQFDQVVLVFLPWITMALVAFFVIRLIKDTKYAKRSIYKLLLYLSGLILFFAMEDQICSSLLLFAERGTSRKVFGWAIPSSFIAAVNPIVILFFGAFIARRRLQMIIPFILTGGSFALLALFCLLNFTVSIFGVIGIVAVVSLAELMIGPLVLSYASKVAAKGNSGVVTGVVPIAFSLAFQISGGLGKMVTTKALNFSSPPYGIGFGLIAFFAFIRGNNYTASA